MKIEFSSKVFLGNKNKHTLLKIIVILFIAIMGAAILIKMVVGDFSFSNIWPFLLPLLLYQRLRRNSIPEPQYAMTVGNIDFQDCGMKILYENIDGGKNLGRFDEEIELSYSNISSVEYSVPLACFRIIANCNRSRIYKDIRKMNILNNDEEVSEIFIYVFDEAKAEEIKKGIQRYASFFVRVLEE